MENELKKLLQDILLCIQNIEQYIGSPKIFELYNQSQLIQDATERNLITIGEAVNNLLRKRPEISIQMPGKLLIHETG